MSESPLRTPTDDDSPRMVCWLGRALIVGGLVVIVVTLGGLWWVLRG